MRSAKASICMAACGRVLSSVEMAEMAARSRAIDSSAGGAVDGSSIVRSSESTASEELTSDCFVVVLEWESVAIVGTPALGGNGMLLAADREALAGTWVFGGLLKVMTPSSSSSSSLSLLRSFGASVGAEVEVGAWAGTGTETGIAAGCAGAGTATEAGRGADLRGVGAGARAGEGTGRGADLRGVATGAAGAAATASSIRNATRASSSCGCSNARLCCKALRCVREMTVRASRAALAITVRWWSLSSSKTRVTSSTTELSTAGAPTLPSAVAMKHNNERWSAMRGSVVRARSRRMADSSVGTRGSEAASLANARSAALAQLWREEP